MSRVFAQTDQNDLKLQEAQHAFEQAVNAVLDAESAHANITSLLNRLNNIADCLSQAKNAHRAGNNNLALTNADSVIQSSRQILSDAQTLKESVIIENQNSVLIKFGSIIIGSLVFVLVIFLVWCQFKRRYLPKMLEKNSLTRLKLSNYKTIFVSICLIGVLLIASPAIADAVNLSRSEVFSELFLLGPEKMSQDIPFDIEASKYYAVYVGVGNHMQVSTYYVCNVMLRNQTESLPNQLAGTPSSLDPLYEYQFAIQNGENFTAPLVFFLSNVQIVNNQAIIGTITINDVIFDVQKTAEFDQENDGYYYQLIIELWAFNSKTDALEYQSRFVYFWLKL